MQNVMHNVMHNVSRPVARCLFCGRVLIEYSSPETVKWLKKRVVGSKNGYSTTSDGHFIWFSNTSERRTVARIWLLVKKVEPGSLIRDKCPHCKF